MFIAGILMILATAAILLFVEKDLGTLPIVLGIIGISMMGASNYRLLKNARASSKPQLKERLLQ
jgi:hypothetical protein